MSQLSPYLRLAEDQTLIYWCDGCDCHHSIRWGVGDGPRWTWNSEVNKPTFSPSVLYKREMWVPPVTPSNLEEWKKNPWPQEKQMFICHTFITDGMVQYLDDCSHHLKGQTVPIPVMPGYNKDEDVD